MREAVIVSTARTPIGKAYRGADTQAQTLSGHAIAQALARANVDGGEVDDRSSIAATGSASTTRSSTSTAARLRSATPTE